MRTVGTQRARLPAEGAPVVALHVFEASVCVRGEVRRHRRALLELGDLPLLPSRRDLLCEPSICLARLRVEGCL